jgi:hypothetical protein
MPLRSMKLNTMNIQTEDKASALGSAKREFLEGKGVAASDSESLDPILGMIALCYWVFSPSETTFSVIPLVFALGSLTLLVKGAFLLRNSPRGKHFLARRGYRPTHIISNRVRLRCYFPNCTFGCNK